ncbi:MAG TPA: RES domain-containing protein [Bryobacteraceae bacterium]|jgi:RES domain-containing protein
MIIFRIGSRRYPANDGAGSAKFGGRWNHKGISVIYAAESRALCALEILANNRELANDYIAVPIEISDDVPRTILSVEEMPRGWNSSEHSSGTRDLGTAWVTANETAALVVPSAVLPRERNYLLNPQHPEFKRIVFHEPEPFYFDERLALRTQRKDQN